MSRAGFDRNRFAVALIMAFTAAAPLSVEAGSLRTNTIECVSRFLKKSFVDPFTANYEGRTFEVTLTSNPARIVDIRLGKALGSGFMGRAYVVESIQGVEIPDSEGVELIVKVPHHFFTVKDPKPTRSGDLGMVKEFDDYQDLSRQVEDVWSDPLMKGKEDYLVPGHLPMAPILKRLDTSMGVLLIKPKLKGMTLADVYKKYGDRFENLPDEMRTGLKNLYEVAQAIHRRVKLPEVSSGGKDLSFRPDIKPENYIWVDDPNLLATLGMRKPGFAFFELSSLKLAPWQYREEVFNFESYRGTYEEYLRFHAAPQ